MREIVIIGYPSKLGGADTELDHQIYVWQALGWKVHVIHTGTIDANLKAMRLEDRNCVVHSPRDWSKVRNRVVISYCNGEFLKALPQIRKAKPKLVLWVNCMRWLFDEEKEAHRAGNIDWFIYQTDSVRVNVEPALREINPLLNQAVVNPYFFADGFTYRADKPEDRFRFCRISRDDLAKYHVSQLWVYETMVAPVLKEGIILGVNDAIRVKLAGEGGSIPNWIKALPPGGEPVADVYARSHALIQMADPSLTENLPRIGFEAMATGTALCVDDRGGWQEQVVHGQTGFLCRDQRDFAYYSSRLAFERGERRQMIENARDHLISRWSLDGSKQAWAGFFDQALGSW